MSAPNLWPSGLPLYPSSRGFSGAKEPGKVAFQPESGAPIVRRAQTARVDLYDATFAWLRRDQVETFRTFYDDTLAQGALKFAMAHPVKQVVREAQIVGEPTEASMSRVHFAISFRLLMVDVAPSYAADVTLANGFVEYTGA